MTLAHRIRTAIALASGVACLATAPVAASASPTGQFNVQTTISASCSVTNSGPSNLSPTYTPTTDSVTGSATSLATLCTGPNPQISFSDSNGGSSTDFIMMNGSAKLYYYLSNNTSCAGTVADNPIAINVAFNLTSGNASLDICAAPEIGGVNVGVPAGTYTDTVYYTISG